MSENLPAVQSGGAVVVQAAGAVLVDAAVATGALGGFFPDSDASSSIAVSREVRELEQLTASTYRELLTAAAVTPAQLGYAQEVIEAYAPQFRHALQTSNRAVLSKLADHFRMELIAVGALTEEQVARMRPILARVNEQFERGLRLLPIRAGAISAADVEEMRALNLMMADPGSAYWYGGFDSQRRQNAARLQARWRELYDRGVRGDALPPTPPERLDARIAQIEQLMGDTASEYHRGPNAAALQSEYRDLIDQREQARRR